MEKQEFKQIFNGNGKTKKIRLDLEFVPNSEEAVNEALSKFRSENKSLIVCWTER